MQVAGLSFRGCGDVLIRQLPSVAELTSRQLTCRVWRFLENGCDMALTLHTSQVSEVSLWFVLALDMFNMSPTIYRTGSHTSNLVASIASNGNPGTGIWRLFPHQSVPLRLMGLQDHIDDSDRST